MKILTNDQYKILTDKIKKLQWENKRLARDLNDLQRFCMNYASDHQDIDFPNSSKEPKSSDDIFFN